MNVLVTGGTGTLGQALVKSLDYDKLVVFSRDEFKQSEMAKTAPENVRFLLGDIRDKGRLLQSLDGIDVVIHAAALKQVPALEYNPTEAVKTNVIGSMNVVEACCENGIKSCVLISTDKAVNPINLYGSTKLTAEKIFLAANAYNKTKFNIVRYGNVIGSRGSVFPYFDSLKGQGEPLKVTSLEMTRFWITKEKACKLVKRAIGLDGRLLIPNIPSCSMKQIVECIYSDCESEIIGIRPGEKMHESLLHRGEEALMLFFENNSLLEYRGPYNSNDTLMTSQEVKCLVA